MFGKNIAQCVFSEQEGAVTEGGAVLIDWAPLHARLATTPAVPDAMICDAVVAIANGDQRAETAWRELAGVVSVEGDRIAPTVTPYARATLLKELQTIVAGLAAERALDAGRRVDRKALEQCVAQWQALRSRASKSVSATVLLSPTWSTGVQRNRIIAVGEGGGLSYGLRLLVERTDLRRCRDPECRRFFFAARPRITRRGKGRGRPRTELCANHNSPRKKRDAQNRLARDRQRDKRKAKRRAP